MPLGRFRKPIISPSANPARGSTPLVIPGRGGNDEAAKIAQNAGKALDEIINAVRGAGVGAQASQNIADIVPSELEAGNVTPGPTEGLTIKPSPIPQNGKFEQPTPLAPPIEQSLGTPPSSPIQPNPPSSGTGLAPDAELTQLSPEHLSALQTAIKEISPGESTLLDGQSSVYNAAVLDRVGANPEVQNITDELGVRFKEGAGKQFNAAQTHKERGDFLNPRVQQQIRQDRIAQGKFDKISETGNVPDEFIQVPGNPLVEINPGKLKDFTDQSGQFETVPGFEEGGIGLQQPDTGVIDANTDLQSEIQGVFGNDTLGPDSLNIQQASPVPIESSTLEIAPENDLLGGIGGAGLNTGGFFNGLFGGLF